MYAARAIPHSCQVCSSADIHSQLTMLAIWNCVTAWATLEQRNIRNAGMTSNVSEGTQTPSFPPESAVNRSCRRLATHRLLHTSGFWLAATLQTVKKAVSSKSYYLSDRVPRFPLLLRNTTVKSQTSLF